MARSLTFRWHQADAAAAEEPERIVIDMQEAVAELVAMWSFVVIGCGVACGHGATDGETRLLVAFAFGMAILVLAYAVGHLSGGQINCAVTFSLVLGGHIPWYQGLVNSGFQLIGSVLGALFLASLFPCDMDMTGNLASNVVGAKFGVYRALLGEAFGTFLLCMVVWETAISKKSQAGVNACLAIGFAVFLAHLVLLPIDGCSINPTRSFGPAIVAHFLRRDCDNFADGGLRDLWVTWAGPLLGAAAGAGLKHIFSPKAAPEAKPDPSAKYVVEFDDAASTDSAV
eukprot:CAMPEP_0170304446 /NCGR_PEP_ID=MMETSP0116_2-20130129/52568_1 /TAXON_ID=400756 /ORGANISM="Durinskia baltica, Strain CSIRO CS-38" /LENGTH=284 /DNA_ID=CAMNT_0010556439 /DNA_START=18 /DNA_END=870 /DNA_ORIENTATION=-